MNEFLDSLLPTFLLLSIYGPIILLIPWARRVGARQELAEKELIDNMTDMQRMIHEQKRTNKIAIIASCIIGGLFLISLRRR